MLTIPVESNSWVFSRATLPWAASVLSGRGSVSQAQKDMKSDVHLWGKGSYSLAWVEYSFLFSIYFNKNGFAIKTRSPFPPCSSLVLTAHVIVSSLLLPPPPPTSEGATFGAETSKLQKVNRS